MADTPERDAFDWQTAGKRALTSALNRADDLARECGDLKQLDSIIKTIGEIVGTGLVLGRKQRGTSEGTDDEQDD